MRADSFCANPGEGFSFTGDDGMKWKGICKEIRPIDDGKYQFRGILTEGREELLNTEICGQYDPKTDTLEIIH